MEATLNILGFSLLALVMFFCLLYLFKRDLFRKIDNGFERLIGALFGNLVVSIGIIVLFAGIFVIGFQVYSWISQGKWLTISMLGITKAGIVDHISSFLAWVNSKIGLGKSIYYIFQRTPLSILLLLAGLFIAFLGLAIGEKPGQSSSSSS